MGSSCSGFGRPPLVLCCRILTSLWALNASFSLFNWVISCLASSSDLIRTILAISFLDSSSACIFNCPLSASSSVILSVRPETSFFALNTTFSVRSVAGTLCIKFVVSLATPSAPFSLSVRASWYCCRKISYSLVSSACFSSSNLYSSFALSGYSLISLIVSSLSEGVLQSSSGNSFFWSISNTLSSLACSLSMRSWALSRSCLYIVRTCSLSDSCCWRYPFSSFSSWYSCSSCLLSSAGDSAMDEDVSPISSSLVCVMV